jgi:hypothetical protein
MHRRVDSDYCNSSKHIIIARKFKNHIERMEKEDPKEPDKPDSETATYRVNWAINIVRQESLLNQEILADLRQSLTAVCP